MELRRTEIVFLDAGGISCVVVGMRVNAGESCYWDVERCGESGDGGIVRMERG